MTGPVSSYSYGVSIFFQYLSEKYDDTLIRELWEASAGAPSWFDAIDGVLQGRGASFAEAFFGFARANLFTNRRSNPTFGYARASGFPLVNIEAQSAPLTIMSLRVFPSATAYLGIPPAGRAQMDVSLVNGDASLRLALAVRRGNTVEEPILADASLRATANTDGADELLVVVANTAQSGESSKPGLCAGDTAEVDACRVQLGATTPMMTQPSGGCAVGGHANTFPLWFLVAVLLVRRRRVS
jgi:hypothetical protein